MVFVHALRQVLVLWPRLTENAGESEAQDAALDEHGIQLASWLSLSPPLGLAGRPPHTALLFALGSSAREVMGTVCVHGLRQLQRHPIATRNLHPPYPTAVYPRTPPNEWADEVSMLGWLRLEYAAVQPPMLQHGTTRCSTVQHFGVPRSVQMR